MDKSIHPGSQKAFSLYKNGEGSFESLGEVRNSHLITVADLTQALKFKIKLTTDEFINCMNYASNVYLTNAMMLDLLAFSTEQKNSVLKNMEYSYSCLKSLQTPKIAIEPQILTQIDNTYKLLFQITLDYAKDAGFDVNRILFGKPIEQITLLNNLPRN